MLYRCNNSYRAITFVNHIQVCGFRKAVQFLQRRFSATTLRFRHIQAFYYVFPFSVWNLSGKSAAAP
jgi:hypothetical protein